MALVEIEWRPDASELRKFGIAMLVGFAVIAVVFRFLFGEPTAAVVCLVVGGIAGGLALTGSQVALPIYWVWMGIAFVLGNIVSRLILALIYYGVLTPMGLAGRAIRRRDRLSLRHRSASYWLDMPSPKSVENYERQF